MWGLYPNIAQAYREQVRLRSFRNGCISLYVASDSGPFDWYGGERSAYTDSPWAREFRSRFMPERPKDFWALLSETPSLKKVIKAHLRGDATPYTCKL